MEITSLRGSSLNTYSDCQFKYYLIYVLGFFDPSGISAHKGSCVHLCLELMAKAKRLGRHTKKSKFNDYKYLLEISYNRIKKENPGNWDDKKDKEFCLEQVETVLATRFHPYKLNILATEHQFDLTVNKTGFKIGEEYLHLRGTIDLITEVDKDTIEIIDYKTGQRKNWITGKPKEIEDLQKDIQFRIYELATSKLYASYKNIIFTVFFTRDGGPFTFSIPISDRVITLDILRKTLHHIKNNAQPLRLKDDKKRYRNESFKCKKVCHFGKTLDSSGTSLCDKYYRLMKSGQEPQLIQLSVDEKLNNKLSRRNDYNKEGISKANLFDK